MVANHSHKEWGNMIVGLKKKTTHAQSRVESVQQIDQNWVTKAIRNCFGFGFTLLRSVIGQEKSHHALDQSDVRPKSILIFPRFWQFAGFYHAFSLAPHCIFPSSDWPLRLLCLWSYDPKSRSALSFSLLRLTSTQVVKRDYYYANESTKRYTWL